MTMCFACGTIGLLPGESADEQHGKKPGNGNSRRWPNREPCWQPILSDERLSYRQDLLSGPRKALLHSCSANRAHKHKTRDLQQGISATGVSLARISQCQALTNLTMCAVRL